MTVAHSIDMRTLLTEAAENTIKLRWQGLRCEVRSKSQLKTAVSYFQSLGLMYLDEVEEQHVIALREWSLEQGLAPSSVNVRMSTISAMGIKPVFARLPRGRKWFLSPEDEAKLASLKLPPILLAFVSWTVATGLRVEESLALQWQDVDLIKGTAHVSGTKTDMAQALLPISAEALGVLRAWQGLSGVWEGPVFPITYIQLRRRWERARKRMGWSSIPTATLKSLRRSFARRAHVNGMPVDILRQYLRHSNIKTTQGYLWLVGGYSQDEMRRYL